MKTGSNLLNGVSKNEILTYVVKNSKKNMKLGLIMMQENMKMVKK